MQFPKVLPYSSFTTTLSITVILNFMYRMSRRRRREIEKRISGMTRSELNYKRGEMRCEVSQTPSSAPRIKSLFLARRRCVRISNAPLD